MFDDAAVGQESLQQKPIFGNWCRIVKRELVDQSSWRTIEGHPSIPLEELIGAYTALEGETMMSLIEKYLGPGGPGG